MTIPNSDICRSSSARVALSTIFVAMPVMLVASVLVGRHVNTLRARLTDAEAVIRRNEHRMEQLAAASAALTVDGSTLMIEGDGERLRWEIVVPDVCRSSGTAASLMELIDRPAEVVAKRSREATTP